MNLHVSFWVTFKLWRKVDIAYKQNKWDVVVFRYSFYYFVVSQTWKRVSLPSFQTVRSSALVAHHKNLNLLNATFVWVNHVNHVELGSQFVMMFCLAVFLHPTAMGCPVSFKLCHFVDYITILLIISCCPRLCSHFPAPAINITKNICF